jgi:hypothetical protein
MAELFVIWESRSPELDALWWRPNASGYTNNLDEAGRYTKEEADRYHANRKTDVPVPLVVAVRLSQPRVWRHAIAEEMWEPKHEI